MWFLFSNNQTHGWRELLADVNRVTQCCWNTALPRKSSDKLLFSTPYDKWKLSCIQDMIWKVKDFTDLRMLWSRHPPVDLHLQPELRAQEKLASGSGGKVGQGGAGHEEDRAFWEFCSPESSCVYKIQKDSSQAIPFPLWGQVS